MKPVDKKDQPKLIAIIVACVCVLGWLGYSSLGPQGAATPPATAASAATGAPAAGAATTTPPAAGTPGTTPVPGIVIPTLAQSTSGKDPFIPNGSAATEEMKRANAGQPPVAPRRVDPGPASLRPLRVSPSFVNNLIRNIPPRDPEVSERPALPLAAVPPMPMQPPPAPAYTMTGVVMGTSSESGKADNVAILRGGEKQDVHRFVRVGDPVDHGYTVTAIGPKGIELRESGGHRVTIALGKKGG